ncbi:MAG: hypothetical protein KIT02_10825 [Devosia sp.]|uniref:hypothetical protein n=1 Tax=Devosia sp. TaxID=1871048 RepID=UPI0024C54A0B|nr:hypothetical protein [Devosia sp.]UYN98451.1 MAG: hypothetical protein KIT02_10825 [Devosia sp.]
MSNGIGIAPSVMINRMVHEAGVPQSGHLLEVARLRAEMMRAQTEAALKAGNAAPEAQAPINGAEVDLLI